MRISTSAQNIRINDQITSIQRQINDAQLQISTGKLSQTYSGYGAQDVRLLISLKEQRTSVQSYVDTINATKVKTTAIDATLTSITDIAQDLRKKLYEQVQGLYGDSSTALQTYANATIDQLTNLLNQSAGGKYLFNGTDTDAQPMIASATTKAAYTQPALSGGSAAVITNVQNFFATDTNWNNVTTPAPGSLQARVDKGVDVSYGELGNDDAFETVFEVLYAFANVNFQTGDDTNYQNLVNWGIGQIESAFDSVNDMVGQNGVVQAQLEDRLSAHADTTTILENQVTDIEDVDPYKAVSTFQTLQAQLESSYQTTAILRNLSLTKYL